MLRLLLHTLLTGAGCYLVCVYCIGRHTDRILSEKLSKDMRGSPMVLTLFLWILVVIYDIATTIVLARSVSWLLVRWLEHFGVAWGA